MAEKTQSITETRKYCERMAVKKKKKTADAEENCYRDMHNYSNHLMSMPSNKEFRDNYEKVFGHK